MNDLTDCRPGDTLWTTADVARYLGINHRKIYQTVSRWGVEPVAEAHVHRGGASNRYRAIDIVTGKAGVRRGGSRRMTFQVGTIRYTPGEIARAFGVKVTTWRNQQRMIIPTWPQLIGLRIWVHLDPGNGLHHTTLAGKPLATPEAGILLANRVHLDVATGELRASWGLSPHSEKLRRGVLAVVGEAFR